jgi:4-diphosphocytidyl-2-C-methyl-D-erythritol kinase
MVENILKLKSYAKINLYLNIERKSRNGYHNIENIMQTIDLYDDIYLKQTDNPGIFIKCNNPEVPIGNNSIIYKVTEILMKNINKGIKISINKRIPLAAGLGGGSSNVGTILIGLCKLFNLKIDSSQLIAISTKFGMDIPFFIVRGTIFARGRGELIVPLKPIFPSIPLILINPGIKIPTKWAYHLFDKLIGNNDKTTLDISSLLNKKEEIKPTEICRIIYNSFDAVLSKEYPIIEQMKNRLKSLGSAAVNLSGSGPTVYGIFKQQKEMVQAFHKIKDEYPFVCKTRTVQADRIFL